MKKLFFICTIFIVACSVEEDLYDNEKSQITVNQDKIKQTSRSNNSGKNVNKFYSVDLKVEGEGEIKMSVVETGMAISVLSGKNKSSGNSIKAIDNLKPNDSSFINGTKIKLEAIPKYDFIKFEEWSGDISGMENPVFVTIDNQKNIKGKFVNKHIYLADNGKTIKARETAQIGDKGIINGEVYTIVDETTLREMVKNNEDVTKVVTTKVTDMNFLFYKSEGDWEKYNDFNQNISSWDVSNVKKMYYMFFNCDEFDQDLSDWDVSNVDDMHFMFHGAKKFNSPLNSWNTSKLNRTSAMFLHCLSFDQPLDNWDVSNVTNFSAMFQGSNFNHDISNWDMSNATNIVDMFANTRFNYDVNSWDVSNVEYMWGVFHATTEFNQPLDNWDVSNVIEMGAMFSSSKKFNQDISSWCVSKITEEPSNFSVYSQLENTYKPVWGTCPD